MQVAKLFIALGIKGDSPAAKALKNIKGGLDGLKDASLESKAALLGAIYAAEKFMTGAAKRGQDLNKFANLTGLSTQELQKWQYAARQSGVSADDMQGSIVGVQKSMTDMLLGFGAPKGMGIFTETMARAGKAFDPNKARDTFYVLSKLREFAQITPPDISNEVLASFGLTPDSIQFMRSSKIEIEKIKPTNIYTDAEIKQLNKIAVGWDNFWQSLKVFQGHEVATFGLPIINQLESALKLVQDMIKGIEGLIKQFPILGDIAKAAFGVILIALTAVGGPLTALSAAATGLIYLFGEIQKFREGKENLISKGVDFAALMMGFDSKDEAKKNVAKATPTEAIAPSIKSQPSGAVKQEVNIHQTNHYSGETDPKRHANSIRSHLEKAVRTLPAQQQGS